MQKQNLPIGVFDSGVGGVSVLKEMHKLMPNENYIYIGDSKNAPYGTKSHEEIFVYADSCAKMLIAKGVKALVVACNTATSVCIDDFRQKYRDIPVVGIEPALKPAVESGNNRTVVVMATPLTLKEKKFDRLCQSLEDRANIIRLPCPGLMELIEGGHIDDDAIRNYLKEQFSKTGYDKFDAVVLGCTHYPFVKKVIGELHPKSEIFDGGVGTAKQVERLLRADNLLTDRENKGEIIFENTLGDEKINNLAKWLMNM